MYSVKMWIVLSINIWIEACLTVSKVAHCIEKVYKGGGIL